jgi:hypothetical protein
MFLPLLSTCFFALYFAIDFRDKLKPSLQVKSMLGTKFIITFRQPCPGAITDEEEDEVTIPSSGDKQEEPEDEDAGDSTHGGKKESVETSKMLRRSRLGGGRVRGDGGM